MSMAEAMADAPVASKGTAHEVETLTSPGAVADPDGSPGAEAKASPTSPPHHPGSLSPNNRIERLRAEATLLRKQPSPPQVRPARFQAGASLPALTAPSSSAHGFQRRTAATFAPKHQEPIVLG